MAHAIDFSTGSAAIALAGQSAWHRLGTVVEDAMTSEDAFRLARLDWHVDKKPVSYFDADSDVYRTVPGQFATVRSDTGSPLGIVGPAYSPVQNKDAFAFMDSLVTEGEIRYETAGALDGGSRVWMLAKLPSETVISADDVTNHYLLLYNGHDGSTPCAIGFTTIRVVCANTLRLASGRGMKREFRIRHVGSIDDKLNDARIALGIAQKTFAEYTDIARRLSFKDVTQAEIEAYIGKVFGDDDEPTPQKKRVIDEISRLAEIGAGAELPGVRGTMWGALNAVTEWVDHTRPQKQNGRSARELADGHVHTISWGAGSKIKDRALELAVASL